MFPQEVRDQIYDYVAVAETNIGLHVRLKERFTAKSHAYAHEGLSHVCRQMRQEYSPRLERRVKDLVTELNDTKASAKATDDLGEAPRQLSVLHKIVRFSISPRGPPKPALAKSASSHSLRVADLRVSKGVYIEEDMAYSMTVPFANINDPGLRLSKLTVTFASSAPRTYNNIYPLNPTRDEGDFWREKGHHSMLFEAVVTLSLLTRTADWTNHKLWLDLFWHYNIVFPRKAKADETFVSYEGFKGRSDDDIWWKTSGGSFAHDALVGEH